MTSQFCIQILLYSTYSAWSLVCLVTDRLCLPVTSTDTRVRAHGTMSSALHQPYFLGAPATKLLCIASVLSYILIHSQNAHSALSMDTFRVLEGDWYRLLTSHITFGSMGEVVLGNLIVAHFSRRFERELGSRKYVCWLIAVYLVAIPLIWTVAMIIITGEDDRLTYAGPYPTLGALLYLFYRYTPRLHPRFFGVLGFHVSEKVIPYAFALQMMAYQGMATLIPTVCGCVGGWLAISYPMDVIPNGVADFFSSCASRLLVEGPPGMLAPRQQQHHHHAPLQQQPRVAPVRQQPPPPLPRGAQPPPQPPSQVAIEQLTSMGFDRDTVVRALEQSNNSVERALDRLLTGT